MIALSLGQWAASSLWNDMVMIPYFTRLYCSTLRYDGVRTLSPKCGGNLASTYIQDVLASITSKHSTISGTGFLDTTS